MKLNFVIFYLFILFVKPLSFIFSLVLVLRNPPILNKPVSANTIQTQKGIGESVDTAEEGKRRD